MDSVLGFSVLSLELSASMTHYFSSAAATVNAISAALTTQDTQPQGAKYLIIIHSPES